MILTILLSLMMMAGLFLLLLSGIGFIQDRRFFTSAPREVQDAVQPREERFCGAHAIGWIMAASSFLIMGGAVVIGAADGIAAGYNFGRFFVRFLIMLILLKVFDIVFFDWVLLCNAGFNFFPHYFPETKDVLGRHLFGYNIRTHLMHVAVFPFAAAAAAWICTMI